MAESHDHDSDVEHHVKIYLRVFYALAVLTVVTVWVAYLHLPLWLAVIVALCIAAFKGSLVACFFMHLISEKKMIYCTLLMTLFFFLVLLFMPTFWHSDLISLR